MVVISDGMHRPLYYMKHDNTYYDLNNNPISKEQASKIKYRDYETYPTWRWGSFWIGFCFASLVWGMLNYFINYYNGIN